MKRKLIIAVNIFAATLLCVSVSACGGNAGNDNSNETGEDSVVMLDDIGSVDWNSVPEAERVSEPAVNSADDAEAVQHLTVLDFSATWCGPCKGFAPIFHEVAKEYGDQATFRTIDIDQERELAGKYNVQVVPTIVILDAGGKELTRVEGAMSKSEFVGLIKEYQ